MKKNVYTCITESLCCTVKFYIGNQLYFNKMNFKRIPCRMLSFILFSSRFLPSSFSLTVIINNSILTLVLIENSLCAASCVEPCPREGEDWAQV